MTSPVHALSVDVEDSGNVLVLYRSGRIVAPGPQVVENTKRMLELFESHGARATWFLLGEVAAKFPTLVRTLHAGNQEIGVHGYYHHFVHTLTASQFRDQTGRAKDLLEQITGRSVIGYRAPAFSITKQQSWAFDVLCELGFCYDSSIFPFRGSRYGDPDASVAPYEIPTASGGLVEIPLSVLDFGPLRLPCCGGGYFRHFPLTYTRIALNILARRNRSAVFYLHPYELQIASDHEFLSRFLPLNEQRKFWFTDYLQYRNRRHTVPKLQWLLRRYRFDTIASVFALPRANQSLLKPQLQ